MSDAPRFNRARSRRAAQRPKVHVSRPALKIVKLLDNLGWPRPEGTRRPLPGAATPERFSGHGLAPVIDPNSAMRVIDIERSPCFPKR